MSTRVYIEWDANDMKMYLHKKYNNEYIWIRIKPSMSFNTIEEAKNWWHFNSQNLGMQYREHVKFIEKDNNEWYR